MIRLEVNTKKHKLYTRVKHRHCKRMSKMSQYGESVFYWSVCHVCKKYNENDKLMRCGKCKMIYYCSKDHQKQHWSVHKSICRAVCRYFEENDIFTKVCCDAEEWCNMRIMFSILVELSLKRQFSSSERQMILFPKLCELCKVRNSDGIDCKNCLCVSYCSMEHQVNDSCAHKDKCSALKMCRQLDLFQSSVSQPNLFPRFYTTAEEDTSTFPRDMVEFLSKFVVVTESRVDEDKTLCSELLTCPLSLVYALLQGGTLRKNNLIVHVVGADQLECCMPYVWESVLHWLPQIEQLNLIFIGPGIGAVEYFDHLCKKCSDQERKFQVEMYSVLYQEYMESENKTNPDVIATFNPGLHEYEGSENDTWSLALPYFLKFRNIPIIMTAYTQAEAEKDVNRLASHETIKTNVSSLCQKNPFASCRPHRDWAAFHSDVFYNNNFISFVTVKS